MSGDWQNQLRGINNRAFYIYQNKLLCDAEFVLDGELKIKCHKLILAMASPVFQAMFYGRSTGSESVEITDIESHVFQQILEFIYGQEIKIVSHKNAFDIYYGAKKYLLSFLERDCIEYLKNNLSNENVLHLYEFAKFHNESELEKQCLMTLCETGIHGRSQLGGYSHVDIDSWIFYSLLTFLALADHGIWIGETFVTLGQEIQMNTQDVVKNENIAEISDDTLESILDLNLMNISTELDLFQAVENWALHNMKDDSTGEVEKRANSLLRKLRLLTLTVEEFAKGPAHSKLLSDSQKLAVLLRIANADQTPLENGLCELKSKRKPAAFKCLSVLEISANERIAILEFTSSGLDRVKASFAAKLSLPILEASSGLLSHDVNSPEEASSMGSESLAANDALTRSNPEDDISDARCDGSEWLTSVFKSNVAIDLLGVELQMQVSEDKGYYVENIMVKASLALSSEHFAEGVLCRSVYYNTKAQVMFNNVVTLEPGKEYAIHIFLCRPGMYPIGRHANLSSQNGSVTIEFVSHSSWERSHPYNTTVLSSIIYSDLTED